MTKCAPAVTITSLRMGDRHIACMRGGAEEFLALDIKKKILEDRLIMVSLNS